MRSGSLRQPKGLRASIQRSGQRCATHLQGGIFCGALQRASATLLGGRLTLRIAFSALLSLRSCLAGRPAPLSG
ncbi:MAG: hypothetical protein NTW53_18570, partial [Burkholderiales bacterium]|nr:hypothetical protein [Burkholderiales bacterium]